MKNIFVHQNKAVASMANTRCCNKSYLHHDCTEVTIKLCTYKVWLQSNC